MPRRRVLYRWAATSILDFYQIDFPPLGQDYNDDVSFHPPLRDLGRVFATFTQTM